MGNIEEAVRKFRDIKKDYEFHDDIMDEDDETVRRLKYIIGKRLNRADETIIVLYSELESLRDLGKALGISHTIVHREVRRIVGQIKREYKQLFGEEEYERLFGNDIGIGDGSIHR